MLRFGLIGYGKHARWTVADTLKQSKKCDLVAIADINPDHLSDIKDPNISLYQDYRQMIAKEKLDAVYVCTLCETHAELTITALEAGLAVLCEKPMSDNVESCRRMVETGKKTNRLIAIDFESRYSPPFRKIKEWINAGYLGDIQAIHMQSFWDGHKVFGELAERRNRFIERSGCLDCGIHCLDRTRYFCGGDWQDIHAVGAWFGEKTTYPPHIAISARLSSGVLVTLNDSFSYGAYIEPTVTSEVLSIVGTKGVIRSYADEENHIEPTLTSEKLTDCYSPGKFSGKNEATAELLADFADVFEGRKPLPDEIATGEDGLMAQIIVDEANQQAVMRVPAEI